MKKYKAILFDMDGTLVPMDLQTFIKAYMKEISATAKQYLDEESFSKALWASTGSMIKNDGKRTNQEVFWETFKTISGIGAEEVDEHFLNFYRNDFNILKRVAKENTLARETILLAKEKSEKVVLATNPYFPMIAQKNRIKWVDINPEDFDLITSYEEFHFCKPNINYYLEICERICVEPSDCLMIGNDEEEDAYAAKLAGMDAFVIDDFRISSDIHPWNGAHGSYIDMVNMLRSL